jgi:uncharacterized OB-fold protein
VADLPKPIPEPDTEPFWAALKDGELRIQRCGACGTMRHPPRPMCANCNSFDVEWVAVEGTGTVFSYIVSHQAVHPALVDRVPFGTVVVELDEGPRLVSNLVGVPPAELSIGTRVRVVPTRLDDEITLPLFELIADA